MIRDEIINILMTDNDWPWTPATADKILALIEGERCEWTLIGNEMGSDFYRTSCGEASFVLNKYCRYCGRKVEVKDEAN